MVIWFQDKVEVWDGKHVGWFTSVACAVLAVGVVRRLVGLWRSVAISRRTPPVSD
jgi:hypothetical protein